MKNASLTILERQRNPILTDVIEDETKELTIRCTVGSDDDGFYGIKELNSDKVLIPNLKLSRGGQYEIKISKKQTRCNK